jgi:hypothetical protein
VIVRLRSNPAQRSEFHTALRSWNLPLYRAPANAILAPNFKFEDMGIGGLDSEFSQIFRRAFSSRVFPPALVEKLGIEHVKGNGGIFPVCLVLIRVL